VSLEFSNNVKVLRRLNTSVNQYQYLGWIE